MNAHTASAAVMARRLEPADSLDFFPTPPWGTRAFCIHVLPKFEANPGALSVLDPGCGEGHMALALGETFGDVTASDIHPYGFGGVADFLHPSTEFGPLDWVAMNPPFNLAAEFIRRALEIARRGVAVLVRSAFLEGEERFEELFSHRPPALVAQFVERLPMHRRRWVINGRSATAYSWLIWFADAVGTAFDWIPKSRRSLTRHDDWLRFGGCMDIPKGHPCNLDGKARQLTIEELLQSLASRAKSTALPTGAPEGLLLRAEMELLI